MNLKELLNQPKYARVIGGNEYVGEEFEVGAIDYNDGTVSLEIEPIKQWFLFKNIQFLTNVEYNGRKIGIGDEVSLYWNGNWCEVYGDEWLDGEWKLLGARNKDYESGCFKISKEEIQDLSPLYPENKMSDDELIEELIEELKKRGKVREGKIIN